MRIYGGRMTYMIVSLWLGIMMLRLFLEEVVRFLYMLLVRIMGELPVVLLLLSRIYGRLLDIWGLIRRLRCLMSRYDDSRWICFNFLLHIADFIYKINSKSTESLSICCMNVIHKSTIKSFWSALHLIFLPFLLENPNEIRFMTYSKPSLTTPSSLPVCEF